LLLKKNVSHQEAQIMKKVQRNFILVGALLALALTSVPARSEAGPSIQRTAMVKKENRILRKAKAVVRRLAHPLRPQKRPISLNWAPKQKRDFNIVGLVKGFQSQIPKRAQKKIARATSSKLADAHSVTFTQKVDDGLGRGSKRSAVHLTRGIVDVPLSTFLKRMPAEKWGVNLDHYLGGQVKVVQRDRQGSPTKQVERMVLSGLPGNLNIRALNLDMSKVEQKEIVRDRSGKINKVTMYWRVHDSANRTTMMDVGSVSFEAQGKNQTKVVFHSAHRLGKNGLVLPSLLVRPTLRSFFSDHVRQYRKIAGNAPADRR